MIGSGVSKTPSWTTRYSIALLAVIASTACAFILFKLRAPTSVTLFIYLIGIMAASWWGGYGPGALATILGSIIGPYIAVQQLTIARIDPVRLLLILTVSLLVSRIAVTRRKTEETLRSMNAMLDHRVHERTADLRLANEALRKSEARLSAQTEELLRSNTDLAHFAYIASHDLQEPLRMIGIYVQLLERKHAKTIDADAQTYMGFILDGVRRMERLVLDLLAYSRVIHETSPLLLDIELAECVRAAIKNLEPVINESGATFEICELPNVRCHRTQFIQVFQNLLANALKYRTAAAPRIGILAERSQDGWMISVSDNGIGIGPEYHTSIFKPFKRLHGQEYSGTGIGLAICKRIVERRGGRIWVESNVDAGSRFHFTLPDTPPEHTVDATPLPTTAAESKSV